MSWTGPVLVALLWSVASTQLFLQAWLATADIVVAILALIRSRVTPARAASMAAGACISGASRVPALRERVAARRRRGIRSDELAPQHRRLPWLRRGRLSIGCGCGGAERAEQRRASVGQPRPDVVD